MMSVFRRNRKILMIALAAFILAPILALAQVAWVKNFDAALKQAAKEKKFVILDISASW
jgi:hypothetical protein